MPFSEKTYFFYKLKDYYLFKKHIPVTTGESNEPTDAFCSAAADMVSKTPALVPTQTKSLHDNKDVTRKQAALCCLMMSSQLDNIFVTCIVRFTLHSGT